MDFFRRIYHKTRNRLGFRNKNRDDDDINLGRVTPTYRPGNELDPDASPPKRSWFPMRHNRTPRQRSRSSPGSSKGWMSRIATTLKAPFRRKPARQHYEEYFGGRKSKRRR